MPTVLPRTTCGDPYPGNQHYTTRCEKEPGHPGNMHRNGQLGWERSEETYAQRRQRELALNLEPAAAAIEEMLKVDESTLATALEVAPHIIRAAADVLHQPSTATETCCVCGHDRIENSCQERDRMRELADRTEGKQ